MYTTNLPDDVMIPDLLVRHMETGTLSEEAKADARTWVDRMRHADQDVRAFWKRQLQCDVSACKKYGVPAGVAIFSYVYELVVEAW